MSGDVWCGGVKGKDPADRMQEKLVFFFQTSFTTERGNKKEV